jgi:hypothetical protein
MKINIDIMTTVEFEIRPDMYPSGMDPDTVVSLEIEQASQNPYEYLAMPAAKTFVTGQLVRDNGEPVRHAREKIGWMKQPDPKH